MPASPVPPAGGALFPAVCLSSGAGYVSRYSRLDPATTGPLVYASRSPLHRVYGNHLTEELRAVCLGNRALSMTTCQVGVPRGHSGHPVRLAQSVR